jgi:hypothetical protein
LGKRSAAKISQSVRSQEGESIENALRGFKRKVQMEDKVPQEKPATRQGWQGHANTSEWLLPVEEIGEGLRVRRSQASHVIPARSNVQAGIRTE